MSNNLKYPCLCNNKYDRFPRAQLQFKVYIVAAHVRGQCKIGYACSVLQLIDHA